MSYVPSSSGSSIVAVPPGAASVTVSRRMTRRPPSVVYTSATMRLAYCAPPERVLPSYGGMSVPGSVNMSRSRGCSAPP